MAFNMTNISDANTTTQLVVAVNSAYNAAPITLWLVILWLAAFFYATNRNMDNLDAMLTSSFLTTLVGGLAFFVGLISWERLIVPIVFLLAAIIIRMMR